MGYLSFLSRKAQWKQRVGLRGCCLTNRWSPRGCRRDEVVSGWEATLRVVEGAGPEPQRGSAQSR